MRWLMWISVGFSIGCGLCAYFLKAAWILPTAFVCAGFLVASLFHNRRNAILLKCCAVLAGLAVGLGCFSLFHSAYLLPLSQLDGKDVSLAMVAADYGKDTGYSTRFDAVAFLSDRKYRIRVDLPEGTAVAPGDEITGTFFLRIPTADGSFSYYSGEGIFVLAYGEETVRIQRTQKVPLQYFGAVLRCRIEAILNETLPESILPFCRALLLGETEGLDYGTDTALKISGVRHIVAVSGLHISVLCGIAAVFALRGRFLSAVLGIPLLVVFGAAVGFSPSVVRACWMMTLMLLSNVFRREYDGPTALAFSVLCMLLRNPLAITSVSFQLSVGCVAGIQLFYRNIRNWLKKKLPGKKGILGKLIRGFCSSVAMTLSAIALTTPLSALYFGSISLVGVAANLLTVWAVTFVFSALLAVCVLWLILPGAATVLGYLLRIPVGYILMVCRVFSRFPLAAVYTVSPYITVWLFLCYLLLAVFLWMKFRRKGELLCCMALSLCLALLLSWMEPKMDDTRITMLDVGQGQSILLQSGGCSFLVDCGGDNDESTADIIAENLLGQGISRLDAIVLTHYDRDHAGALPNLLNRIQTDRLILPDTKGADSLSLEEVPEILVRDTVELSFGAGFLTVYGPIFAGDSNENGLCVLFDTEKCDILITGDRTGFGERMLMRNAVLPDVDILVAGHHGSKDSTTEALLQMVKPEIVLISVGAGNYYGHPDPELLQRLEEYGCAVYRTDQNGTCIIRR